MVTFPSFLEDEVSKHFQLNPALLEVAELLRNTRKMSKASRSVSCDDVRREVALQLSADGTDEKLTYYSEAEYEMTPLARESVDEEALKKLRSQTIHVEDLTSFLQKIKILKKRDSVSHSRRNGHICRYVHVTPGNNVYTVSSGLTHDGYCEDSHGINDKLLSYNEKKVKDLKEAYNAVLQFLSSN